MPSARLLHFREHAGTEVDWVIEDAAGRLVGVEVKASPNVNEGDLAGLRSLKQAYGDRFRGGVLLYCGAQAYAAGKDLCIAPVSSLWNWRPA